MYTDGQIDLKDELSGDFSRFCMNPEYSDVTFIVNEEKIFAHKNILAMRNGYFRGLLYGGLAESTQREIKLNDVPLEAFKATLKYIYTGCMALRGMDEHILDVLNLAELYGIGALKLAIVSHLTENVSEKNCCKVVDAARLYNLEALSNVCMDFMDRNASKVLASVDFGMLTQGALCTLLERDSFIAPEVEIFKAAEKWCENNAAADFSMVLSKVRLPLMDWDQLFEVVRACPLVDSDCLLDAIRTKTAATNMRYRGVLLPNENVATAEHNSNVIRGDHPIELLNGDFSNYDGTTGHTSHTITDTGDESIVVELGTAYVINHIKLLLWDKDTRSYSYYIETSVDQKTWTRVIDYTENRCRSLQFLYFPSCAVRYIKLVGTNNTVNKWFHVVALEAYYTTTMPTLMNELVLPTRNVATTENGALVIQGTQVYSNVMLNGDVNNLDNTHHKIGSGAIIVQLSQPYNIGSLRLLLYDGDDRTYSFYIETSVNQSDWEMVVDKRDEKLRSWQTLTFTPRPVAFFKIVGTFSSITGSAFRCVHFECPAQISIPGVAAQV